LFVSLAITFLPFGQGNAWKQVFSFFGLSDFSDAADAYPMSMHVLDVGKADSILIESNGHFMLVDGGTAD
jgi:competence protein ComEC